MHNVDKLRYIQYEKRSKPCVLPLVLVDCRMGYSVQPAVSGSHNKQHPARVYPMP